MSTTRRPKKKLQGAINEAVNALENLLALASQQGYLIEMKTVEYKENGRGKGRITIVEPGAGYYPIARFQLYIPVDADNAEQNEFKPTGKDDDNGTAES